MATRPLCVHTTGTEPGDELFRPICLTSSLATHGSQAIDADDAGMGTVEHECRRALRCRGADAHANHAAMSRHQDTNEAGAVVLIAVLYSQREANDAQQLY